MSEKPPGRPGSSASYLPRLGSWQFIPNVGVIVPQEVHGTGEHSVWAYQVYKEIVDGYRREYEAFVKDHLGGYDPADSPSIVRAADEFMRRLDGALAATLLFGRDASARGAAARRLHAWCAKKNGFRMTDAAAHEVLRKVPPRNLIVKLGCRSNHGLLERMAPLDALAAAACTDGAPYPDMVLDVIEKCAGPDWFAEAPVEMLVVEPALSDGAELESQASALARLAGRVPIMPLSTGDGCFPNILFAFETIRGIVATEVFGDIYRGLAASGGDLGRAIAQSVRGHWGRFVASAYHVFENKIDRAVAERLVSLAGVLPAGEAASLVRAAAGVYHLSITLPDATFVPLCAATWASFRNAGGTGVPPPLAARAERDWTTSDFFSLYLERTGLGDGAAIQSRADELVAQGRQSEDLRAWFFDEVIDRDELLVRQTLRYKAPPAGRLTRPVTDPLLTPTAHSWESRYVLNAGVIRLSGTIYILYRAFGDDEISRVGLAWTRDGIHIEGRLDTPIFSPANDAESAGCEDVRTVRIGQRIYMLYTAWDRKVAQIAMASIDVDDFLAHRFSAWQRHGLAFPGLANKDAVIYPERINGKYVAYHRIDPNMWVSYLDELSCPWPRDGAKIIASPRTGMMWDGVKIGAGGPPIRTTHGWLNIYHGVDYERRYRLGVFVTALDDPARILYRSPNPILEPETPWELGGVGSWVPRVVFTCGAAPTADKDTLGPDDGLLVYYGAADTVIGVAKGTPREIVPVLEDLG